MTSSTFLNHSTLFTPAPSLVKSGHETPPDLPPCSCCSCRCCCSPPRRSRHSPRRGRRWSGSRSWSGASPTRASSTFSATSSATSSSPPPYRSQAYGDFPLPIEEGQTISQPYIVAIMTSVIAPDYKKKVLEIGTGSGYQAAVLAELVREVYTIEIIPDPGPAPSAAAAGPGLPQHPLPDRQRLRRLARGRPLRRHHRHLRAGPHPGAADRAAGGGRPHGHPHQLFHHGPGPAAGGEAAPTAS